MRVAEKKKKPWKQDSNRKQMSQRFIQIGDFCLWGTETVTPA